MTYSRDALRLVLAEFRRQAAGKQSEVLDQLEVLVERDANWEATKPDHHVVVNVAASHLPEAPKRRWEALLESAGRGFLAVLAFAGAAKAAWDAWRAGKGAP